MTIELNETKNKALKNGQKLFIIELEINSIGEWWDSKKKEFIYSKGKRIFIPVESNTWSNAVRKLENTFSGSEYPSYTIKHIHRTDEFLFDYKILKNKR